VLAECENVHATKVAVAFNIYGRRLFHFHIYIFPHLHITLHQQTKTIFNYETYPAFIGRSVLLRFIFHRSIFFLAIHPAVAHIRKRVDQRFLSLR